MTMPLDFAARRFVVVPNPTPIRAKRMQAVAIAKRLWSSIENFKFSSFGSALFFNPALISSSVKEGGDLSRNVSDAGF